MRVEKFDRLRRVVFLFLSLMTLGTPWKSVVAIILAALLFHDLKPGPLLLKGNPA